MPKATKKPGPNKRTGKPSPKNKTSKRARRVAIVKGLVEQHTPSEIAAAIGVTRKTVYEELRAPETQELIRKWLEPYHGEVQELIPEAISAVRAGLFADEIVDRLRAVKSLGIVMGWAQGKAGEGENNSPLYRFKGTMEELLIEYRKLTSSESQGETSEALQG